MAELMSRWGHLLAAVVWAWCILPAHAGELISIDSAGTHYNLLKKTDFLQETGDALAIQEVAAPAVADAFQPMRRKSVNFGVIDAAYWFRFTIRNESDKARLFYIELDNPHLQYLDFYTPRPYGGFEHQRGGSAVTTPTGLTRHDWPVFQTMIAPRAVQQCFLRAQVHGPFLFRLRLWAPRAFMNYRGRSLLALGLLYGMLAAMVCHSLFVYFILKERTYLYNALVILSLLLYELSLQGTAYQYLWPFSPWWEVRATAVIVCVAFCAGMGFARAFLNTRHNAPRLDKLLLASMGLSLGGVLANLSDSLWATYLTNIFGVYAACLLVATAGVVALRHYRPALFIVTAWGLVLVCGAVYALVITGILPAIPLFEFSLHFGIGSAPIVFALALARRLRDMRQSYRTDLERQVAERTTQLQDALDNVKTLKGLIPICSHCKKVRDDKGYWSHIESYIQQHSEADLSHSLCPTCIEHLYGTDMHSRLARH